MIIALSIIVVLLLAVTIVAILILRRINRFGRDLIIAYANGRTYQYLPTIMDPLTLTAFISAMMASLSVWQNERSYRLSRETFDRQFLNAVENNDFSETVFALQLLPPETFRRLSQRVQVCWGRFTEVINPEVATPTNVAPPQAEADLRECVCEALRIIYRLNGAIPPGPLAAWWNHFACGPLIR